MARYRVIQNSFINDHFMTAGEKRAASRRLMMAPWRPVTALSGGMKS